jgi:hypothetical protein
MDIKIWLHYTVHLKNELPQLLTVSSVNETQWEFCSAVAISLLNELRMWHNETIHSSLEFSSWNTPNRNNSRNKVLYFKDTPYFHAVSHFIWIHLSLDLRIFATTNHVNLYLFFNLRTLFSLQRRTSLRPKAERPLNTTFAFLIETTLTLIIIQNY